MRACVSRAPSPDRPPRERERERRGEREREREREMPDTIANLFRDIGFHGGEGDKPRGPGEHIHTDIRADKGITTDKQRQPSRNRQLADKYKRTEIEREVSGSERRAFLNSSMSFVLLYLQQTHPHTRTHKHTRPHTVHGAERAV